METTDNIVGKFLDPDSIIKQLKIGRGSVVADFGCGPGYFSLPFAKSVGEKGKVYSLDVLPQALETVEGKAKAEGISNIVVKRVNLENKNGSKLEDGSTDWVIMKDVIFQNRKKDVMIGEAHRVLKIGGRAVVVEWNEHDFTIGPDREVRVPKDDLEEMFKANNFSIEKTIDAGDFHYSFVAIKK